MLSRRLALDVERATMNHWDKHTAKRCFADFKIYCGILMYMGGKLSPRLRSVLQHLTP